MTALFKALQVILALSVLIVFHELGHFTFAKIFGIRVDKFFLFFDVKGIKLFSTMSKWFVRLFPKAESWETEYGIGWLPLGGYCKISGMIDESMDLETMKQEPKPWEFRTKPAWQRLLVMAGGVLFNFILAIALYSGILASQGQSYIANDGNCIYASELAQDMGFRSGDHIICLDDYVPENFYSLQADLARRKVHKATVLRDGDTLDIYIDQARIGEILNSPAMFDLAVPFVIESVAADSPNADADLQRGDRLLSVEGESFDFVQDSRPILERYAGCEVAAKVQRDSDLIDMNLQVDTLGKLGVYPQIPGLCKREYTALQAIPAGFAYTWRMIRDYVRDLGLIATPSTQAYKSVGSFVAIGQVFPSAWDWLEFIYILALLSIMLGVMNLIPIPGLDGGHIVFTLYEMLTGRKPSDKFMAIAQMIGMALLIMLMFLAFGNDIGRIVK